MSSASSPGVVGPVGLVGVVQPEHRRGGAALDHPTASPRARRRTRRAAKRCGPRGRRAGCRRSRAPVMTPSVPSLPTNSWVRSGPTAAAGQAAGRHVPAVGQDDVEARRPCPRPSRSGRTAGRPTRHASQPPTVDSATDWGQWPTRQRRGRSGARARARRRRSRAGRRAPATSASTSTMPAMPVRSRTRPPWSGTDAPHTPLRPPAAVTGTWASSHTASTAATSVGVGGPGHGRREPGHLALGGPRHRERPPVPAGLGHGGGLDRDLGARRRAGGRAGRRRPRPGPRPAGA